MTDLAALTALFPPASREAWLTLVDKTLKGAPRESLGPHPLYTEAEPVAVGRAPGLDPKRPWQLRTIADHPDPSVANRQILEDLRGGAASVLLRIGAEGVALSGDADINTVLDGVMLELAPVALEAGFAGPLAADALAAAAQRSPRALLAFHLDPISAFAEAGASPGPMSAHLDLAARTALSHAEAYPLASLFLATGRTVHEAGGSDVQELAFMAASAVAYLRALTGAGLAAPEALKRIVLGVSIDGEFLDGVAKLRAARLIWDQLAQAIGSDQPAAIEARASRRMLSRADLWTNLLRLTAANFAGAVGGALLGHEIAH